MLRFISVIFFLFTVPAHAWFPEVMNNACNYIEGGNIVETRDIVNSEHPITRSDTINSKKGYSIAVNRDAVYFLNSADKYSERLMDSEGTAVRVIGAEGSAEQGSYVAVIGTNIALNLANIVVFDRNSSEWLSNFYVDAPIDQLFFIKPSLMNGSEKYPIAFIATNRGLMFVEASPKPRTFAQIPTHNQYVTSYLADMAGEGEVIVVQESTSKFGEVKETAYTYRNGKLVKINLGKRKL